MKVDLKDILDSTQIILISDSEKHNLIQNKIILGIIIIILLKKMDKRQGNNLFLDPKATSIVNLTSKKLAIPHCLDPLCINKKIHSYKWPSIFIHLTKTNLPVNP